MRNAPAMKYIATVLMISAALVFSLHGQATGPGTTNVPAKKIGVTEATNHYNEVVTVAGKIAEVNVRSSVVILNFEKPFPDSPFSAVVFARSTNKFGPLTNLEGKDVEVSGLIKPYHGKPEIIMSNATQLTIVGSATKSSSAEQK